MTAVAQGNESQTLGTGLRQILFLKYIIPEISYVKYILTQWYACMSLNPVTLLLFPTGILRLVIRLLYLYAIS